MEIGELLGSGRSADVYAVDGDRVLRRYREPLDARREVAVMAHVARHGFPVPDVYPGVGEGHATDLVMRRLSGPTMLRAAIDGEITPAEAGRVTARLLLRLHTIPALVSGDPRDRVLHLDLHPDNVLLTPDGPFVIDWCNSREGLPGQDCAMSALIMAQVAVDEENELAMPAREMLVALLGELGGAMDYGDGLDQAKRTRGANPTLSAREVELIDAAGSLIRELSL
ncbi:phosphotransferase [Nonomuraea turcica]|uniref:phosphotransferase n=1 Tax=Nonomuraea sp. G32 TaxID=3067274 RepID=UPI00273BCBE6|nr:phosphotransferase [Nonomuraea sp. G32]MDP4510388.1 phosphotransferase [Nonomuraea sp. G32]